MSQEDVLQLLKRNRMKWFTATKIEKILKISSVARITKILRESKSVRYRRVNRKIRKNICNFPVFEYRYKIT